MNHTETSHGGRIQPFKVIYPSQWQGSTPRPRDWLVQGAIMRRTVCLFSGDSGLGKSLLMQQLLTCSAMGLDWMGFKVEQCRSYGFFCEDDENELHHRQNAINRLYGLQHADLELNTSYSSRVGMNNVLMTFNARRNGGGGEEGRTTPVYDQLRQHVRDIGAQLIIIDTAAQTFGGNELFRSHVTGFMSALQSIAVEMDGCVVLTSHPSTQGLQQGTGYSGSTAWKGSARCHMYLRKPYKAKRKPGE